MESPGKVTPIPTPYSLQRIAKIHSAYPLIPQSTVFSCSRLSLSTPQRNHLPLFFFCSIYLPKSQKYTHFSLFSPKPSFFPYTQLSLFFPNDFAFSQQPFYPSFKGIAFCYPHTLTAYTLSTPSFISSFSPFSIFFLSLLFLLVRYI